jgi:signal transduction histidine kinase
MVFKKQRLAIATTVYWVLLAYIVIGLAFWFFELESQSRKVSGYRLELLRSDSSLVAQRAAILEEKRKKTAQYIGEGSTFLFLILLGALYVYREVRRQIRLQLQQQNFMMAVTHELKTPIAVTKLNLETLIKHKLDGEKQQKIIRTALQETNRLIPWPIISLLHHNWKEAVMFRRKRCWILPAYRNNVSGIFAAASPTGNGRQIFNPA